MLLQFLDIGKDQDKQNSLLFSPICHIKCIYIYMRAYTLGSDRKIPHSDFKWRQRPNFVTCVYLLVAHWRKSVGFTQSMHKNKLFRIINLLFSDWIAVFLVHFVLMNSILILSFSHRWPSNDTTHLLTYHIMSTVDTVWIVNTYWI